MHALIYRYSKTFVFIERCLLLSIAAVMTILIALIKIIILTIFIIIER